MISTLPTVARMHDHGHDIVGNGQLQIRHASGRTRLVFSCPNRTRRILNVQLPSQNLRNPAVVPENHCSSVRPTCPLLNSVAAASVMGNTVLDLPTRIGTSDKALVRVQLAVAEAGGPSPGLRTRVEPWT